jgi:hypothetical protein
MLEFFHRLQGRCTNEVFQIRHPNAPMGISGGVIRLAISVLIVVEHDGNICVENDWYWRLLCYP